MQSNGNSKALSKREFVMYQRNQSKTEQARCNAQKYYPRKRHYNLKTGKAEKDKNKQDNHMPGQ